jgi:hypothetical protein
VIRDLVWAGEIPEGINAVTVVRRTAAGGTPRQSH